MIRVFSNISHIWSTHMDSEFVSVCNWCGLLTPACRCKGKSYSIVGMKRKAADNFRSCGFDICVSTQ